MLVEAIDEFVDKWQNERRGLSRMFRSRTDAVEPARGLGVVWGDQIVRHFEWSWICEIRDGEELFAVAAPNRSLVIYAPQFIHDCLHNPRIDCTVMLAFNMQESRELHRMSGRRICGRDERRVSHRPQGLDPPCLVARHLVETGQADRR